MTAPVDVHDEVVVVALRELRERRRRRRMGDWHVIDALYRAYLAAMGGILAVTFLSGLVGDERLGLHAVADVRAVGPAVVGAAMAVALAMALRSGARGGPLALEAAEVRCVMLAPVDRDVALRQPALRQLRFSAFAGMVLGALAGLLAYRRLPGPPVEWVVVGGVVGLAGGVGATGAAMVASGRRMGRRRAALAGAGLMAWSALDVAQRRVTSPASVVGRAAVWPLAPVRGSALALAFALTAAGLLAWLGLVCVGGLSLEAAERRGRLVSGLRFAATFQDLRTVMLLRRQLASEVARRQPWLRLRPAGRGPAIWRRDWRGILRWPAVRLARLAVLGVVAGLATAAAWAGTTPLVLVAGAAMFVAALDATEGLAQEIDHPDRRDSLPISADALHLRHLAAPTVVLSAVAMVGVLAAAAVSRSALAFQVGLPLAVPAGGAAAGAAAVSALRGPPDPGRLMADATGFALILRHALPPLLATTAPAASLLVHARLRSRPATDPVAMAADAAVNVGFVVVLMFGWVRQRQAIAGSFSGPALSGAGR